METLGADRTRITAALGPTISQANYEVGPEFVARFTAADADNARFFAASPNAGHAMFDLPGYIADRIQSAGIVNFEDLGLCTYAEPDRFYSFRRTTHRNEPDYGRHINAIVLADTGHAGMWMGGMYDTSGARQSFLRSAGHLGWAFPAGLGAKCAAPERIRSQICAAEGGATQVSFP